MASRINVSALALVLLGNGVLAVCSDRAAAQSTEQELTSLAGGWNAKVGFDSNGKLDACVALRLPDKVGMMFGAFAAPAGKLPAAVASPERDVWGIAIGSESWQLELGEKPRSVDVTFDAQAQFHVSAYVENKQTLFIPAQAGEIARQFRKAYAVSVVFEGRRYDFSLAGTFKLLPVLTNCLRTSSIKGTPAPAPVGKLTHGLHQGVREGQAQKDCDQISDLDRKIAGCSQLLARRTRLSAERRFLYHMNRSLGYAAKGEHDSALADVDAASVLDPESYIVFFTRGLVYLRKGELDLALNNYNAAIVRSSRYSAAYIGRGDVYTRNGEFDRALADYDRAIRVDAKASSAYSGRGRVYLYKGRL
jgi:tetratricopeptide (TPR) repeat protein